MVSNLTRRRFVTSSGAAVAGAIVSGVVPYRESIAATAGDWDQEADVLVAGSGPAGASAALFAHQEGAVEVLMIERGPSFGGTMAKSEGGFWIPNNRWMRDLGLTDTREDALKYMARVAYPADYNPEDQYLGVMEYNYSLLALIYDSGATTIDQLHEMGAINVGLPPLPNGELITDYFIHLPENKAGQGRSLMSLHTEGEQANYPGNGAELARQLRAAIDERNIQVLYRHRAIRLIENSEGEVVGLEVVDKKNRTKNFRARRGVLSYDARGIPQKS